MPYRVAAKFHLHHSAFMKENVSKWNEIERKLLMKIVPAKLANNVVLFNALELALSFDSWLQLRLDQGLSPKQANNTKKKLISALISDYR